MDDVRATEAIIHFFLISLLLLIRKSVFNSFKRVFIHRPEFLHSAHAYASKAGSESKSFDL